MHQALAQDGTVTLPHYLLQPLVFYQAPTVKARSKAAKSFMGCLLQILYLYVPYFRRQVQEKALYTLHIPVFNSTI